MLRYPLGERVSVVSDRRVVVTFGTVYLLGVMALYRFSAIGTRPFAHYLLFSGYAAFIAYQVAGDGSHETVVPQIALLGFLTYWSSQFAFPSGAYSPDVPNGFLPAIRTILDVGHITPGLIYAQTPGHMLLVAQTVRLTGLSPEVAYYLTATIALTTVVFLLPLLFRLLPDIDRRITLYATLLFATTSFILGRGLRPNKLNFFYPLIVLLAIAAFATVFQRDRRRWLFLTAIVAFALASGHTFSSGAAMMLLATITVFSVLDRCSPFDRFDRFSPFNHPIPRSQPSDSDDRDQYSLTSRLRRRLTMPLRDRYEDLRPLDYHTSVRLPIPVFALTVGIALGYSLLYDTALIGRLVSIAMSITGTGTATGSGGAGRYSQLPLAILVFNTANQAVLFALTAIGAIVVFRYRSWSYDLMLAWVAVGAATLAMGILLNATDIPPQRIYSLLTLFGLNALAAVALDQFDRRLPPDTGRYVVVGTVYLFAALALSSSVAGFALSPTGDQIPHFRRYDTISHTTGTEWVDQYGQDALTMSVPQTTVPIRRLTTRTGVVDRGRIVPGQTYVYSRLAAQSGIELGGDARLGGAAFVFAAPPPDRSVDDHVYAGGGFDVYQRRDTGRETDLDRGTDQRSKANGTNGSTSGRAAIGANERLSSTRIDVPGRHTERLVVGRHQAAFSTARTSR
ncbi:hypothetical protein BRC86_04495 [Halobacteriales archaeon QS_3_64_16]|nr:MAG: hypothetical protein BRC86_04495 [Halobacteriales archaeon QS_3_64_16]